MTRIAILADSGCQIELKQYENQGIYIVPLCITMKNHTYLDQQDITSLEVFETMEKEDIMVMTSQPATGELVNILQRIKAFFGQLFHIHLAVRELSGQLTSGGVEPVSYTHLDVYKRQA